ncbi:FIMAH domain-containing protein [Paenibacillus antri]|nr:Ig-like domain-containing protein [Paenibacillus antri]
MMDLHGRRFWIWLMIAALLLGSARLSPGVASAESGPVETSYAFAQLVNAPNDPSWNVAATNPAGMRLTATSFQMINAAVSPDANGEYIRVNFYVPESRLYDVNLIYWRNIVGGTVDIAIDDAIVAVDHSFYHTSDTKATPETAALASGLRLSKGMHTLTFTAKGTRLLASNNRYYAYLYLQQLQLVGGTPFVELDTVALSAAKTALQPGEAVPVALEATLSDGTPVSVTENVYYTSSNPSVLQVVESDGQGAVVSAIADGAATLTAEATYEGVTRRGTLDFLVSSDAGGEPPNRFVYDFKLPVDSTLESAGWEIVDVRLPLGHNSYRHQEYGIQVQANAVGQYIDFDLHVPETGIYRTHLNGAGASSGAVGRLLVDGAAAGEYNFYSAAYQKEKGKQALRTFELAAGVHKARLEVLQRAGYFHLYPGELELVEVDRFPNLLTLRAAAGASELMVGQTTKLELFGMLDDGYEYDLGTVESAARSYVSSDESVAAVGSDGTVTAVGVGTAQVKAVVTLNGVAREAEATVRVNDKRLAAVDVSASDAALTEGATTQLTVTGYADDGAVVDLSDAVVRFESRDPSVATVDDAGVVAAIAAGSATIEATATLGGVTVRGSAVILVAAPALAAIEATIRSSALFVGDEARIALTGTLNNGEPADVAQASVAYASSDETVAVVSSDGRIAVVGPGAASIAVAVTLGEASHTAVIDLTAEPVTNRKTRTTYFTDEKRAAARANIEAYEWARNEKEGAVAEAERFLARGYDALWKLVTPQTIPRSYAVNQTLGSPITGTEINKYGNYPWVAEPETKPWKLTDPSSGYTFPTNDFAAYYESGLDANGVFRQELADRSLLVNTLYPEKGPTWGVDDGNGWVDENGNRWTFVAYYNHWFVWHGGQISRAVNALRDAYVYTGDPRYARAGVILLDRIADVYPDMDIAAYSATDFLNSHGGTGKGKIIGSIWETGLVRNFVSAYDAFFPAIDDPEIIAFLSGKADRYDLGVLKRSAVGIKRNIEDGLVKQIYPAVRNAQIRGNNGMHQATLAMAAVVFDAMPETKEWLDFNFKTGGLVSGPYRVTGGNISALLVDDVDRDGAGNEASPAYNSGWVGLFQETADILDGYDLYPEADLYQNVKFRKMFSATYPLMLSDRYFALIGDTGNAGGPANFLDQGQLLTAFEKYRDPVYAQLAYYRNGNQVDGLHGDIFTADPERIADDIAAAIETHGPLHLKSSNLTGYGFAALRDGENGRRFSGLGYNFSQLDIGEATAGYQLFANSGTIQFNAEAPGHAIAFAFEVPKTDRYEINVKPFRAASYGIYDVLVDGTVAGRIDFYGSSGASSKLETIAELELTEGEHLIRFEGVGKRDAATNYKLGVIQLLLYDEAALAVKNDPRNVDTQRDVWMYYGRNGGHGHKDTLNLGLHAFGLDLLPELGYPEFADWSTPRRSEWENHTISHNTVLVDRSKQQTQIVAQPVGFHDGEMVKLVEVEAPQAYPQTEMYRRTTAMIKVDEANSYAVDFFRVKGGSEHHFSFHAADAVVTTEGLELAPQPTGTYAGPGVEFGKRPAGDSVAGAGYMGPGFHYLKNVARDDSPADRFSVDWNVKDTWDIYGNGAGAPTDVHLRLTMLGEADDVALADGVPPQNKPGNPATMRYLIAHRSGPQLSSTFTSVIEPYKGERYVESIEAVPVAVNGRPAADEDARAVKVTLTNGRTDYIVSSVHPNVEYVVDGKFAFAGGFGVFSEQNGRRAIEYTHGGVAATGTVVDFTRELNVENEIVVRLDEAGVDAGQLKGQYVYIANDGVRNASYRIEAAAPLGDDRYALDIGDVTPIRRWADPNDFSKGYIYDFAVGARFRIPLTDERVLPVTEAEVSGERHGEWYAGEASVTLTVVQGAGAVARTEYSFDGGASWTAYESPVRIGVSGVHEMLYRSTNASGDVEAPKTLTVRVDATPPELTLTINGKAATAGTVVEALDSEPILLSLEASDPHSGVAAQSIRLDGELYSGEPLDFAGRLGEYRIVATATDSAGNAAEAEVTLRISTSVSSMQALLASYIASGEVSGPLAAQLTNLLRQARHHEEKGEEEQSAKHLGDFAAALAREPLREYISERALAALSSDAAWLTKK